MSNDFFGGLLFGNIDEQGRLDDEEIDDEIKASLNSLVQNKSILAAALDVDDLSETFGLREAKQAEHNVESTSIPIASQAAIPSSLLTQAKVSISTPKSTENLGSFQIAKLVERILRPGIYKTRFRFTNFFIPLDIIEENNGVEQVDSEVPRSKLYKLKRLKIKKRKHPRQLLHVDDQSELFRRQLSSLCTTGQSFGSLGKFKILSQIRVATTKKVPNRVKVLEGIFEKRARLEVAAPDVFVNEADLLTSIAFADSHFHPLEIVRWEDKIYYDDVDGDNANTNNDDEIANNDANEVADNDVDNYSDGCEGKRRDKNGNIYSVAFNGDGIVRNLDIDHRNGHDYYYYGIDAIDKLNSLSSETSSKLVPVFAKIGSESQSFIASNISRSSTPRPTTPLNTQNLLTALTGHISKSSSRPATPPILVPPSGNILKNPNNVATRFTNSELASGNWISSIIWDDATLPLVLPSTRLLLSRLDPNMIFDIKEKADVQTLTIKDLSRLNKMILKAKAKRGIGISSSKLVVAPTNFNKVTLINYTKPSSSDRFNLSNDKYYESSSTNNISGKSTEDKGRVNIAVAKAVMSAKVGLQHSVPALKLISPFFKTNWNKLELRHWHRPQIKIPRLGMPITFSPIKLSSKKRGNESKLVASVIRNAKNLTLKDGSEFVLVEYSEEYPSLIMNTGMATFIYQYYRGEDEKQFNNFVPDLDNDLGIGIRQNLSINDPSPFWMFGDVEPGTSLLAIQNNLFRAPMFPHQTNSVDFLAIRVHTKGHTVTKWYLRELPHKVLLLGQIFPTVEVFGPHSRKHNAFCRNRVQVYAYRLFAKDQQNSIVSGTTGLTSKHSNPPIAIANNGDNTTVNKLPPKLKISRIINAFPQFSEGSIRKWLKDYADSIRGGTDSGSWGLRSDAPNLSEDDLRSLVTPEMICQYESMLAGQQRLTDAGCVSELLEPSMEGDEITLDDESGELRLAPWNTTANFINATMGKCWLQLRGPGDPSGDRGEGFSFARIPSKLAQSRLGGVTDSQEPSSQQASGSSNASGGGGKKKLSSEQQAYRAEIAKIWKAQLKALTSSTVLEDETFTQTSNQGEGDGQLEKIESPSNFWTELSKKSIHHKLDDDVSSIGSRATSSYSQGTGGILPSNRQRQLVITRTKITDNGPIIETETINDIRVINAYLRQRQTWETKRKRKAVAAAASAARTKKTKPEKLPKIPKDPIAIKRPSKQITIKCGTCGMVGHMRTNRICPRYAEFYESEQQKALSRSGSLDDIDTRLQGTKLSLSSLDSDENTKRASLPTLKLKLAIPSRPTTPSPVTEETTNNLQSSIANKADSKILSFVSIKKKKKEKSGLLLDSEQQIFVQQLSSHFNEIVNEIVNMPNTWPFHRPVPKRDYPHYYRIIAKPMDLSTIKSRIKRNYYYSVDQFMKDMEKIRDNCIQFNTETHPFSDTAKKMIEITWSLAQDKMKEFKRLEAQMGLFKEDNEPIFVESGCEDGPNSNVVNIEMMEEDSEDKINLSLSDNINSTNNVDSINVNPSNDASILDSPKASLQVDQSDSSVSLENPIESDTLMKLCNDSIMQSD